MICIVNSLRTQLLISLIATILLCSSARANDWPQLLGPSRNGVSDEKISSQFPAGGPAILWQREGEQGFAGPVLSKGRVYLFHGVKDEETLECLDAATGKPIWNQS